MNIDLLKSLYRKILPKSVRIFLRKTLFKFFVYVSDFITFSFNIKRYIFNKEFQKYIPILICRGQGNCFIPIKEIADIPKQSVIVNYDEINNLYYYVLNGKPLYLCEIYNTRDKAIDYIYSLIKEQHYLSPHCYFNSEFVFLDDDIFVDVGSAEGFTSLQLIDKAKRIIIFEADSRWDKALKLTFKNYFNKVIIINKFVSDIVDDNINCISLDSYFEKFKEKELLNIKLDIEGYELLALKGAKNLIGYVRKFLICTYHRENDAELIHDYMSKTNYLTKFSNDYLYVNKIGLISGEKGFRKGVLRCELV